MEMKITMIKSFKVPQVPNFIIAEDGEKYPLDSFTKKSLIELADKWKDNLLERAIEMQNSREQS